MSENELPLAVGIDLGTTYSCIAYIDEYGKPVVLKNFEGDSTTPSVILFDESSGEIVVGKEAKSQKGVVEPDYFVDFVKRQIGKDNWVHYKGDKEYRAEALSSYILRKLVKDAEQTLGRKIDKAVITCPAYFGLNEITATQQAGTIAGLRGYGADGVVNIIQEPVAASFFYGLEKSTGDEVVLVYDLGGGTFDVTLLSITDAGIETICVDGDHELGGKDWDDLITNYIIDCLEEEGIDRDEIYEDLMLLGEIQAAAENAKRALTAREETKLRVGGKSIALSRGKFNELTQPKLDRTISICRDLINEAERLNYPLDQISRILLVGGSTKMPQILERLKVEFPNHPIEFNEPDESVAKGAALFAQKMLIDDLIRVADPVPPGLPPTLPPEDVINRIAGNLGLKPEDVQTIAGKKIVVVTSQSFGVKVVEGSEKKEVIAQLILKNTKLPFKHSETFGTIENNQQNVSLRIHESSLNDHTIELSQAKDIGGALLDLPPGLPQGSPIEVTFDLDAAGLLKFYGKELSSGNHIEGKIKTAGVMSDEEVKKATRQSQYEKVA